MDADLQDRPREVGKLLDRLEQGYDLVSGWKVKRQDPWRKRAASRIFNFVTALLTGVPLHDLNCGLKAYRREVIRELKVYGEMHRFIPVLASYRGFRIGEVPVDHAPRAYGRSKYGAGRFLGGFFDLLTVIMLTRYNSKPLHVFGILGVVLLLAGFSIQAYLTVGWFQGRWIEDRPLFMLGILLLIMGVQFIFFGLLAEMIAYSSRREGDYSVREVRVVEPEEASSKSLVSSARMRIALVGPAHPLRGGIAQYTASLYGELERRHQVRIYSFRKLYPRLLFPGSSELDRSPSAWRVPSERLLRPLSPGELGRHRPESRRLGTRTAGLPMVAPLLRSGLRRPDPARPEAVGAR